jgi:phospholipid/cholesterol/gamma-HCH transport system substrate-binding protein
VTANAKVGLVVLVALVLAAYFVLRIENVRIGAQKAATYRVEMSDAQGLTEKAPVFIRGVRVGKVSLLRLKGDGIETEILIEADVTLREGAKAQVASVGLLGEKLLNLDAGPPEGAVLPPGSSIPGEVSLSLDAVINQMGAVGSDVKDITGAVKDTVASEENQEKIRQVIDNLASLTHQLDKAIRSNQESLHQLTTATARVVGRIDRLTEKHSDDISQGLSNVAVLSEKLKAAATNLEEITDKINSGKGTLGQLIDSPETGNKLNATLTSVQNGVSSLSGALSFAGKTKVTVGARADYLVDRSQAKGYFQLTLRPPSDAFLQLELVGRPHGLHAERPTLRQVAALNGTTAVSEAREQEYTEGMAFSALLGWRLKLLQLRGGLIESRPGFGADLVFLHDRLRLTAEAWDFSRGSLRPHARVEGAVQVYRMLFLTGGWDDWLNRGRELDSFYVGAGLSLDILGGGDAAKR